MKARYLFATAMAILGTLLTIHALKRSDFFTAEHPVSKQKQSSTEERRLARAAELRQQPIGQTATERRQQHRLQDERSAAKPRPTISTQAGMRPLKSVEEIERGIQEMIASGGVHSIDVSSHTVRMGSSVWLAGTLEGKQLIVRYLSSYLELKTGYAYVDILSDQNDTKLGSYDIWNGIRIYY